MLIFLLKLTFKGEYVIILSADLMLNQYSEKVRVGCVVTWPLGVCRSPPDDKLPTHYN